MVMCRVFAAIALLLLMVAPITAEENDGLSLPDNLQVITAENAERLQEIGIFGRGAATALDWHPNGEVLAVSSPTGVWLLDQNLQIIEHTPIQQYITDLAWSSDGTRIAAVNHLRGRCTVQMWDGEFTAPQLSLDHCGYQLRWSADGSYLAIFTVNNDVLLIDVNSNEVTTLPGQNGAWSPSGKILFTRLGYSWTYSDTPTLYTWNVETKEPLFTLDITDNPLGVILWGIDDRTLAILCNEIGTDTDTINVSLCNLDARTGEIISTKVVVSGQYLYLMDTVWNEDKTLLASVNGGFTRGFLKYMLVLDDNTNELTNIGDGMAFDWKPRSDELTAIVGNGEVRSYNARTGAVLAQSQWFTSPMNMIAVRPHSTQIASTGFGYEQITNVWDIQYSWTEPLLTFSAEPAEIVDYTSDGSELVAGGTILTDIVANQHIDAFDPDTGVRTRNIASYYDQGSSPPKRYWNADYTEYVEANDDGTITLPNSKIIEMINILEHVFWSPNESVIANIERIPDDYSFRIRTRDVVTGKNINFFTSGMFAFRGLTWSPDSSQIAVLLEHPTGTNIYLRGLRVFSVEADENYEFDNHDYQVFAEVDILEYEQQVKAAWNSDGTMLAVTLPDGLEIHDLKGDGTPLISLPAYEIVDLEWSTDDRFIVGGSEDGTIRLWGVAE